MKIRIREAMVENNETFLHGIVETDQSFLSTDGSSKCGDCDDKSQLWRGTKELPVF